MTVRLPSKHDCGGEALVAHALWEGLVVRTVVVDLVTELLERYAILALLVGLVLSATLSLDLRKVVLKALVLHLQFVIVLNEAIRALCVGPVLAGALHILHSLLCHSEAVDTLGLGAVVAVVLLDLLLSKGLRLAFMKGWHWLL